MIKRDNVTILQADIQCAISQPLAQVSITKNNSKNHCELANKKKPPSVKQQDILHTCLWDYWYMNSFKEENEREYNFRQEKERK